jgi:hypothetical protein
MMPANRHKVMAGSSNHSRPGYSRETGNRCSLEQPLISLLIFCETVNQLRAKEAFY